MPSTEVTAPKSTSRALVACGRYSTQTAQARAHDLEFGHFSSGRGPLHAARDGERLCFRRVWDRFGAGRRGPPRDALKRRPPPTRSQAPIFSFWGTNWLAMNVAPWGSAITVILTHGASNGATTTRAPSSAALAATASEIGRASCRERV